LPVCPVTGKASSRVATVIKIASPPRRKSGTGVRACRSGDAKSDGAPVRRPPGARAPCGFARSRPGRIRPEPEWDAGHGARLIPSAWGPFRAISAAGRP
jgi:hypothetical protein